ncbi:MAG TPA: MarC family protein [Hyphomicrobiaceae bacterium]
MQLGTVDIATLLLVTVGPLKALIVFGTLTARADSDFRRQVAIRTVAVATIVTLLFVLAGEFLLQIFHITLPALKIAGGIILLLFAIHMVMGEAGKKEDIKMPSPDIAIFPLAMPMMATPQGLVAITVIVAGRQSYSDVLVVVVILLAIMVFNLVCMLSADRIISAIGPAALQVIAKIAGLLLTALAVQLMISAFRDLGLIERVIGATGH